jgi:hypothetical protein
VNANCGDFRTSIITLDQIVDVNPDFTDLKQTNTLPCWNRLSDIGYSCQALEVSGPGISKKHTRNVRVRRKPKPNSDGGKILHLVYEETYLALIWIFRQNGWGTRGRLAFVASMLFSHDIGLDWRKEDPLAREYGPAGTEQGISTCDLEKG